jgi:Flp pilus assembly protein TadG
MGCSSVEKKCKSQKGAAVIEFALILPILLLLLLGTIDGSLALYDKAVITNASREGARAGIVARNPKLTDAELHQRIVGPFWTWQATTDRECGSKRSGDYPQHFGRDGELHLPGNWPGWFIQYIGAALGLDVEHRDGS